MTEITTPKIYAAMSQVMGAVGHISKDRNNAQQGYKFRGIDDIYAALQGPMVAAGVFCVPQVLERAVIERESQNGKVLIYTTLTVKHVFYAGDGSFVEATTVGEAMDSGDKSSNKAMSAALKYAMLEVFCIPTEGDNDSENNTHEVAPAKASANGVQRTITKPAGAPKEPSGAQRSVPDALPSDGELTPPQRFEIVCEEICRMKGVVQGNEFIKSVRAKHQADRPSSTTQQKMNALLELELVVKTGEVLL